MYTSIFIYTYIFILSGCHFNYPFHAIYLWIVNFKWIYTKCKNGIHFLPVSLFYFRRRKALYKQKKNMRHL